MIYRSTIKVLVLLLTAATFVISEERLILNVTFEAVLNGSFRAYIHDQPNMTRFKLYISINSDVPGTIVRETDTSTDGFWIIYFDEHLTVGDYVSYDVQIERGVLRYIKSDQWTVTVLEDSFRPLVKNDCVQSSTRINNGQTTCLGKSIIEDTFEESSVDTSKWVIEHRIPTYVGPNYEFNSYKNRGDVIFLKNEKLFLKPKYIRNEEEVRRAINLTRGCTSNDYNQCYYKQVSSFILPPTISAKIRSKTSFKYGKVEVRAKLPQGDWIYPIVELEPKEYIDGENSAKIWIAYSRGNLELMGEGAEDYGSTLLLAGPVLHPQEPGRSKAVVSKQSETPFNNDFHVYTLIWKPGRMTLYIDSEIYGDISTNKSFADASIGLGKTWTNPEAPFDREYVLALGAGVGGINDFPDGFNSPNDPKPWLNDERNYIKNFFDARNVWSKTWKGDGPALQVDYVKVTAV